VEGTQCGVFEAEGGGKMRVKGMICEIRNWISDRLKMD